MSVLLLTNPFAPQQPPPSAGSALSSFADAPVAQTESPAAVQPAPKSAEQSGAGSSTSFSGSGAGAGGAGAQQPLATRPSFSRPPDAAPDSVVNAQVSRSSGPATGAEAAARRAAIGVMDQQRSEALLAGIKQAPKSPDIAQEATASEMPDPLPTSPFLKGARNAA